MRVIGMDIHRVFAEVTALTDGKLQRLGRVEMRRDRLEKFAHTSLADDDHVVVEATGNATALAEVLSPYVGRVVIANPKQVWLIARAKIKTDKIDAGVLAKLYASGFLPDIWVPDRRTQSLRRQVTRRRQLVRQRTRLKNIIQSILHAHLIPPCPHANITGVRGRAWLAQQKLPDDERAAVQGHLEGLDRLAEELRHVDRGVAQRALVDPSMQRLMTIPGVDLTVAAGLTAAIGDVSRFPDPHRLVAYLGLNPSVRQSGEGPAYHGRITKQGRGHARGMLVEAAWAAARTPGPLRAFFRRIAARRGQHIAAVATARKIAVLAWHLLTRQQDYLWARPALHARKLRHLELAAGQLPARGHRGKACDYNVKTIRDQERQKVELAEKAYDGLVTGWSAKGPKARTGAASEERP